MKTFVQNNCGLKTFVQNNCEATSRHHEKDAGIGSIVCHGHGYGQNKPPVSPTSFQCRGTPAHPEGTLTTFSTQLWPRHSILFYCIVFFLGPHPQHMEVLRLAVKSELQLQAYTTATATGDLSHICHLHLSSLDR